MDAKQYLQSVSRARQRIENLKAELADIQLLSGSDCTNTRVQAGRKNQIESVAVRREELNREIDTAVWDYAHLLDNAINLIHELNDYRCMRVLFLRFIPDREGKTKSLTETAKALGYSVKHTCYLTHNGLAELDKVLLSSGK